MLQYMSSIVSLPSRAAAAISSRRLLRLHWTFMSLFTPDISMSRRLDCPIFQRGKEKKKKKSHKGCKEKCLSPRVCIITLFAHPLGDKNLSQRRVRARPLLSRFLDDLKTYLAFAFPSQQTARCDATQWWEHGGIQLCRASCLIVAYIPKKH